MSFERTIISITTTQEDIEKDILRIGKGKKEERIESVSFGKDGYISVSKPNKHNPDYWMSVNNAPLYRGNSADVARNVKNFLSK